MENNCSLGNDFKELSTYLSLTTRKLLMLSLTAYLELKRLDYASNFDMFQYYKYPQHLWHKGLIDKVYYGDFFVMLFVWKRKPNAYPTSYVT